MNDYLQKNQFVVSEWKGEPAYRTGDALIEGYKYLKWSYENGTLHLEAWMKSTFGKEMGLDGFVGALQKKPYREGLEQLFHVLKQAIPEAGMNEMAAKQGMNEANGQPKTQPVQVKTVDNSSAATMALVFGILAFGISFLSPLISIILAILGYSRARIGMQSALKRTGKSRAQLLYSCNCTFYNSMGNEPCADNYGPVNVMELRERIFRRQNEKKRRIIYGTN